MARLSTVRGKIVRRLGVNIFGNPKYDKLLKRKPQPPGDTHRKMRRRRQSEYGLQLIEKQKLKFCYGLSEKQFRNLFYKAKKMKGITGDNIITLLEQRLDNVVYRAGMAVSRRQARQLVTHGQLFLNDRRVDIPSITVRMGDVIKVRDRKKVTDLFRRIIGENSGAVMPSWLDVSFDQLQIKISGLPDRKEVPTIAEEQLIIEYYSR